MPNKLANESSPYLRQHADNPVDWYPWGDEAFERARELDRPVLLSVGYSSCHWCHVMAHESFENPETAALMNEHFVNVKVDREEHPGVDAVYMTVVQAMTGAGGWPMTVFLTPSREPFYAGTYFPPDDAHGRPGFPRVLRALHEAWVNERDKVVGSARDITTQLRSASSRASAGPAQLDPALPAAAVNRFREAFDAEWGGFGSAPKFPAPPNLEFLLAHHARSTATGDPDPGALFLATETLRHMASGGIYDQLGGGFARYSVDQGWVVPHFEKMLYDNALLARVYLHAWQLTHRPSFERVVRETLAFLQREMSDGRGFFSALDADSEGIEGKFYLWSPDQLETVLGPDDAAFAAQVYGVTSNGNFFDPHHPELTGRTVLTRRADEVALAKKFDLDATAFEARLNSVRHRLLTARAERVRPGLDDKMLSSWNGLALHAFAESARVLGDADFADGALTCAAFLRDTFWDGSRLRHSYHREDGAARFDGLLEDYAYCGLGFIETYRLTGDIAWLELARSLCDGMVERFHDQDSGGFFESPRDGEAHIFEHKSLFDSGTPSGNGAAVQFAWWIGRYFDEPQYESYVAELLGLVGTHLLQAPTGFGSTLLAVERALAPRQELAIVGNAASRRPLESEVAKHFAPWLVLAPSDEADQRLPLLDGRDSNGTAQAYFCENMACQLPVSHASALGKQLRAALVPSA